ncbi:MAG: hypothetical protein HDS58_01580 [Barnesiella sp.]|nr:hypothetical protein [Bacteroidales bacterium]MBD5248760.1 hypothetical protein [Barnesiella sp.]
MAKSSGGTRYSHSKPSDDFKEFRAYSRDWEKTYFDHETGGFVVTHRDRIETGQRSKQEREKFDKEQTMATDLATLGHKIEHLSDINRRPKKTYDVTFDGTPAEFKSVGSHNNVKDYIKHAVMDQGAKAIIVRIENKANFSKVLSEMTKAKKYGRPIYYYLQSDISLRKL